MGIRSFRGENKEFKIDYMIGKFKYSFCCLFTLMSFGVGISDAFSYTNDWESNKAPSDKNPFFAPYVGLRLYGGTLSSSNLKSALGGRSVTKIFYRQVDDSNQNGGIDVDDQYTAGSMVTGTDPCAGTGGTDGSGTAVTGCYRDTAEVTFDFGGNIEAKSMDFSAPSLGISLGAKLDMGVRVELELVDTSSSSSSGSMFSDFMVDLSGLGMRNLNDWEQLGLNQYLVPIGLAFNAELSRSSLGVNLLYDIEMGDLRPFVGVGLGMARLSTTLNMVGIDSSINKALFGSFYDDTAGVFSSAQNDYDKMIVSLIAGLTYDLSEMWTVEAGYKFTYLGNLNWDLVSSVQDANGNVTSSSKMTVINMNNSMINEFFVGIRLNF